MMDKLRKIYKSFCDLFIGWSFEDKIIYICATMCIEAILIGIYFFHHQKLVIWGH